MNGTLIYAESEIQWFPVDWDTFTSVESMNEVHIRRMNVNVDPAKADPKFWEQVANGWYWAFKNKDAYKVEGFYRKYGLLVPLQNYEGEREDSWKTNLEALDWFNLLVHVFNCLETGNVGLLKDLFGEHRYLKTLESEVLLRESDIPLYSIVWQPPHPGIQNGVLNLDLELPTPQNDNDFFNAAWNVITQEVQMFLNLIPLTPATVGEYSNRNLTWRFQGVGAFEAAFLQWYFAKVAPFKMEKCQRKGCSNLLPSKKNPGSPRKYCSPTCRKTQFSRDKRGMN